MGTFNTTRARLIKVPWVPYDAITIGSWIITDGAILSKMLLLHEIEHVRQWKRYNVLFPLLYVIAWIAAGFRYSRNRFELNAWKDDLPSSNLEIRISQKLFKEFDPNIRIKT